MRLTSDQIGELQTVLHPATTASQLMDAVRVVERFAPDVEFRVAEPDPAPSGVPDFLLPVAPEAAPEAAKSEWTKEDILELTRLVVEGQSNGEIGVALGRTPKAIMVKKQRLGLKGGHRAVAKLAKIRAQNEREDRASSVNASPADDSDRAQTVLLSGLARQVVSCLAQLDQDDFTPADDLAIGLAVIDRQPFALIADGLGCEAGDVKARWADIRGFKIITDPRGALTIDGQAALIEALKHRARAAA